MLKLGWMSTGRGPTSLALLRAVCEDIDAGRLDARISFVLTNRGRGEAAQSDLFQDYVGSRDIPLVSESSRAFRQQYAGDDWRTDFDKRMSSRIERYDVAVGTARLASMFSTMRKLPPRIGFNVICFSGTVGDDASVVSALSWRVPVVLAESG